MAKEIITKKDKFGNLVSIYVDTPDLEQTPNLTPPLTATLFWQFMDESGYRKVWDEVEEKLKDKINPESKKLSSVLFGKRHATIFHLEKVLDLLIKTRPYFKELKIDENLLTEEAITNSWSSFVQSERDLGTKI